MFAINDRVTTKVDPRHRGTVVALLSRNFHGKTGVRVFWDSGSYEDLPVAELQQMVGSTPNFEDIDDD